MPSVTNVSAILTIQMRKNSLPVPRNSKWCNAGSRAAARREIIWFISAGLQNACLFHAVVEIARHLFALAGEFQQRSGNAFGLRPFGNFPDERGEHGRARDHS